MEEKKFLVRKLGKYRRKADRVRFLKRVLFWWTALGIGLVLAIGYFDKNRILTDSPLIGFVLVAVVVVPFFASFSIPFLRPELFRMPVMKCPGCDGQIAIDTKWDCANCPEENNSEITRFVRTIFNQKAELPIDPCHHCGVQPPAIVCARCNTRLVTNIENFKKNSRTIIKLNPEINLGGVIQRAVDHREDIANALDEFEDLMNIVTRRKRTKHSQEKSPLDDDLR